MAPTPAGPEGAEGERRTGPRAGPGLGGEAEEAAAEPHPKGEGEKDTEERQDAKHDVRWGAPPPQTRGAGDGGSDGGPRR